MPEMVASRALVSRALVKGNEDSGNEIGNKTKKRKQLSRVRTGNRSSLKFVMFLRNKLCQIMYAINRKTSCFVDEPINRYPFTNIYGIYAHFLSIFGVLITEALGKQVRIKISNNNFDNVSMTYSSFSNSLK